MEIVVRIALVYVFLTLSFRALGKRELSQLSPVELVMLLIVAEIVSPALTAGDESLVGAVIGVATLLALAFANSLLTYLSKPIRDLTEASPSLLVRNGRFIETSLHKDRIRPDEVYSEMHKAGIEDLAQVKWGFLEPDGKMAFIRADKKDDPSANDKPPV